MVSRKKKESVLYAPSTNEEKSAWNARSNTSE